MCQELTPNWKTMNRRFLNMGGVGVQQNGKLKMNLWDESEVGFPTTIVLMQSKIGQWVTQN